MDKVEGNRSLVLEFKLFDPIKGTFTLVVFSAAGKPLHLC